MKAVTNKLFLVSLGISFFSINSANAINVVWARDYAKLVLDRQYLITGEIKYKRTANALANTFMQIPPEGYDNRYCTGNTFAYTIPLSFSNTIYICRTIIDQDRDMSLAQILIHEAAHLAGHKSECSATEIELNAMRAGVCGVAFYSSYVWSCGLDNTNDPDHAGEPKWCEDHRTPFPKL